MELVKTLTISLATWNIRRPQGRGVRKAEHRRVGADAERERHHGGRRELRRSRTIARELEIGPT